MSERRQDETDGADRTAPPDDAAADRADESTEGRRGSHGDDAGDGRWRDWLGGDLREPALQMTLLEAAGHRLLHIYVHLLTVLLAAWGLRITVYKTSETWRETASIATVPGEAVVAGVLLVYLGLLAVTAWSAHRGLRREFDPERAAERLPDERR